jgi:putative tryptophan/tyrosine transport system substrate-binding protein
MQFDQLDRRGVMTLLGGAAAAWPLAARAQPSGKTYRIGFLGPGSYAERKRDIDALQTGLRRLGYEEGKNIVIEYRWADGRYERLPELTAELVKLNVDVLVTVGTPGALAAKQATSTIPIVLAAVGDPVAAGIVDSLARPGGNVTGLTFFFVEICAKRVELIKEAIPALSRIAVLINPANPSHLLALSAMQGMASALGVELVPVEARGLDDIADMIVATTRRAPGLVTIDDPLFISIARQIAELALQNSVPMIGFKPQAEAGALMEYGVDLADLYFRSAAFVDKILKGTRPADLPIERAVKFELVVNLKTAKRLGVELPTSVLIRADEVIE